MLKQRPKSKATKTVGVRFYHRVTKEPWGFGEITLDNYDSRQSAAEKAQKAMEAWCDENEASVDAFDWVYRVQR